MTERKIQVRFYLISDNTDTIEGMRLAGIEGEIVHTEEEMRHALERTMEIEDIGILLLTERLVALCPQSVSELKLNRQRPLIVEIPDRHGEGRNKNSIMRYIREAIGVKI